MEVELSIAHKPTNTAPSGLEFCVLLNGKSIESRQDMESLL